MWGLCMGLWPRCGGYAGHFHESRPSVQRRDVFTTWRRAHFAIRCVLDLEPQLTVCVIWYTSDVILKDKTQHTHCVSLHHNILSVSPTQT